jgi:hypothetical protein
MPTRAASTAWVKPLCFRQNASGDGAARWASTSAPANVSMALLGGVLLNGQTNARGDITVPPQAFECVGAAANRPHRI